jgi:hypothetical protein
MDKIDRRIVMLTIKVISIPIILAVIGFCAGFFLRCSVIKTAVDLCPKKYREELYAERGKTDRTSNYQSSSQDIKQTRGRTKSKNPRLSAKLLHPRRLKKVVKKDLEINRG